MQDPSLFNELPDLDEIEIQSQATKSDSDYKPNSKKQPGKSPKKKGRAYLICLLFISLSYIGGLGFGWLLLNQNHMLQFVKLSSIFSK